MLAAPAHVLVFEPDPRGHAREWIDHIIEQSRIDGGDPALSIVTAQSLADDLRDGAPAHVKMLAISAEEERGCREARPLASGFRRWRIAKRYAKRLRATHVLFLGIDHLAMPLALGGRLHGAGASGVLFRPTAHYSEIGSPPASFKEGMRDLMKRVLWRAALRNQTLCRVHSLDPHFADYTARRAGWVKVRAIGDPIDLHPHSAAKDASMDEPSASKFPFVDEVPKDRTLFVLFGELTERKGVLPFLRALSDLSDETASRIAVSVVGRLDPAIAASVAGLATRARWQRPDLWLRTHDRWIERPQLEALIARADVIAAPYQRFVGSSGVLLWAARGGKPVICQDYGLLGRFVRDHGLGLAVDTTDPAALARAMERICLEGPEGVRDAEGARRFLSGRSPTAFAGQLLADAVGRQEPGPRPVAAPEERVHRSKPSMSQEIPY